MFSKQFVKATQEYCTYDKPVPAPYMRRKFVLDTLPEKASVTVTCTGFYRAFINGTEITPSYFAPFITNPDSMLFYDTLDICPYLKSGENCLAFLLGNGLANCSGGFVWDFEKVPYRAAPAVAFLMDLDGAITEADTQVKCAPSPIFFDDLRSGEFYDARQELPGWNMPDFDDNAWQNALPAVMPRGEANENAADRVVVTDELLPVRIIPGRIVWNAQECMRTDSLELGRTAFYKPEGPETGLIFDFHETRSCVPRLRIQGRKGQEITIQASDYCTDDGDMDYSNTQIFYPYGFAQRDRYICKGGDEEEYIPSFTYHGARYLMVMGLEKGQKVTLSMLTINSDLKESGSFSCSDEIANKLQHAARNSTLANFVCFPTDCPHREKNGWTGDAAMSAEHMLQNVTPEKSWKQWLKMICATQKSSGVLPGIIPTSGWGYQRYNGPAWDQVITELPYQTWKYRGDLSLFDVAADTIMRYLNYISRRRDNHGLIHIGLGDWCHALRGASNHLCPLEVSDTAIAYHMCRISSGMFLASNLALQASFAGALADELRAAFRKYLIDYNTMLVDGCCQTAQAIGLYYGLFDSGETDEAYKQLLSLIHEADDHFDCGMIGVRILFRVLAQHGDAELAYHMITRTDAPSYGIWVTKFGLTSLPETFNRTADGYTSSLNHHFMGDITGFFIAHIAGLQVNPFGDDPAYIRFAPCFVNGMTYAQSYYNTIAGHIQVRWERRENKISLIVSKADGVHGKLVLPRGYRLVSRTGASSEETQGRRMDELVNGEYIVEPIGK